ncbi:voltage-gated potassium channel [Aureococcus anophagefferens]|nr:voltage-gated potassium channel [Aureococcus anophagefferens]
MLEEQNAEEPPPPPPRRGRASPRPALDDEFAPAPRRSKPATGPPAGPGRHAAKRPQSASAKLDGKAHPRGKGKAAGGGTTKGGVVVPAPAEPQRDDLDSSIRDLGLDLDRPESPDGATETAIVPFDAPGAPGGSGAKVHPAGPAAAKYSPRGDKTTKMSDKNKKLWGKPEGDHGAARRSTHRRVTERELADDRSSVAFQSKIKVMMLLRKIKKGASEEAKDDELHPQKQGALTSFRTYRDYDGDGGGDARNLSSRSRAHRSRSAAAWDLLRDPGSWPRRCRRHFRDLYYDLPEVPDIAVTPAGTLDHNMLTSAGGHTLDETSNALAIILNLPGVMRQNRWPQVLMLSHAGFCQVWSLFIIFLVLCQAIFVPVEATFDDFCFAGATEHGKVIVSGRVIAERYIMSKWFYLDLISCIPLDMVLNSMHLEATDKISDNTGLIKALKLLRLFRLSKIMKTMERRTQGGVQFTKLLFGVLLSEEEKRYLGKRYLNGKCKNARFVVAYPDCVHQACLSVAGDGRRAVTTNEQIYFSIIFIYGSIMQATIFGKMAGLLHRLAEQTQAYETKMITISARLKHLGLDEELSERIMRYYETLWETQHMTTPSSLDFFRELTPRLQLDARLALYANMIRQIPFMRKISRSMMEHLIQSMRPEIFMESEAVMRRKDIGDWMLFIEQGSTRERNSQLQRLISRPFSTRFG